MEEPSVEPNSSKASEPLIFRAFRNRISEVILYGPGSMPLTSLLPAEPIPPAAPPLHASVPTSAAFLHSWPWRSERDQLCSLRPSSYRHGSWTARCAWLWRCMACQASSSPHTCDPDASAYTHSSVWLLE